MRTKLLFLILAGAGVAGAQDVPPTRNDSSTALGAERAAIRAVLDSNGMRGKRIVINPQLLRAGDQTVSEGVPGLRPIWRSDSLAVFLGASIRPQEKVMSCASSTSMGPGHCNLIDADVFISASDPRFDGGLATVTVMFRAPGDRSGTYYRSINVVLANTSAGWKVMKYEMFAMS